MRKGQGKTYHKPLFFGKNCLVYMPSSWKMWKHDGAHGDNRKKRRPRALSKCRLWAQNSKKDKGDCERKNREMSKDTGRSIKQQEELIVLWLCAAQVIVEGCDW